MKVLKGYFIKKQKAVNIYCNKCSKEIPKKDKTHFSDFLEINKQWGYFSDSDGETHSFDICQDCYNEFISSFKIPIDKT